MRIQTVLALTDLGKDSLAGLRTAYSIAADRGCKLVVGHVLVPRTLESSDVKEFLEASGLDPNRATIDIEVDSDVHSGIDLVIEESSPDLIVLSSQRKHGFARLLWASVPVGLVGDAKAPVLALHAGKPQVKFSRALVCVDGSPQAQTLLDCAAEFVEEGGDLVATLVIEDSPLVVGGINIGTYNQEVLEQADREACKYLADLRAARPELALDIDCRTGNAVEEILAARVEHDADLVVIGSGGVGGRAQFFLGKVAEGVVRDAKVAALVVPTEIPAADA